MQAVYDAKSRPHRGHLHHLLFDEDAAVGTATGEELSEADVLWGSVAAGSPDAAKATPAASVGRSSPSSSILKPRRSSSTRAVSSAAGVPASMPVQIPDWFKILGPEAPALGRHHHQPEEGSWGSVGGEEYLYGGGDDDEDDDDDDDQQHPPRVIPPHEYLWRRRRGASVAAAGGAAFSLCEGLGRTLKGRDLSRVRNAVWEKMGFQD